MVKQAAALKLLRCEREFGAEWHRRAQKFLGDPTVGVGLPLTDDLSEGK